MPRVADALVRQLRSADTQTLVVSRTRSSFGDRTFAAAGPQVWNSLPPNLRLCGLSYGQFRRLLKTFLFGQWGHGAVWTVFNCAAQNINILTYLLTYLLTSKLFAPPPLLIAAAVQASISGSRSPGGVTCKIDANNALSLSLLLNNRDVFRTEVVVWIQAS